jgi:hypothetical protein
VVNKKLKSIRKEGKEGGKGKQSRNKKIEERKSNEVREGKKKYQSLLSAT